MQVHRDIGHLPQFKNPVVTIGTFDGVHLGHKKILSQVRNEASRIGGESIIITFHPHPRKVIKPSQLPILMLNTIDEKIELIASAGIDHLVVVPFTENFSRFTAAEYITQFLVEKFHPNTIVIGYDHRFGQGRQGDYHLMEEFNAKGIFNLIEIPAHIIDHNAVSSTGIREALLKSDIDTANSLLGYPYFFEGVVEEGNRLGRNLGFPTANLKITDPEKLIPANGVYAVRVNTKAQPGIYEGMMNIGVRPTVDGTKKVIEVNIFDFDETIYQEILKVHVIKYLRDEIKFPGLDALKEQLQKDKKGAIEVLKNL